MTQVIDADARQRALDPVTSFAVTAPAGSGKTELLIQRFLTLLARVEKPEHVLAITFTRKAANEMRVRILEALEFSRNQPPPTQPHRRATWEMAQAVLHQSQACDWQLLDNPNRLRIQTIDSFCMHLVRQLPLSSKLGAEASISDEPVQQYQQAARRLLARLEEDGAVSADLQRLLAHLDNNSARIEQLLCAILGKREQWLRHLLSGAPSQQQFRTYLENCLKTLVEDTLSHCARQLAPFSSALLSALRFAAEQQAKLKPAHPLVSCRALQTLPAADAPALAQWQAVAELLLKQDGQWRNRLTKNEGFPSSTKKVEKALFSEAKAACQDLIQRLAECPGMLENLQQVKALPLPRYDATQWSLLDALTRLLPSLVAELTLVFVEQGQVDYTQISMAAGTALGEAENPTDIALLLDYQLKHILVDEFQDTSTPQFELLARLTEGWEPGDGRTLFIVGDGMQSCYGFREANVGLFLAARAFGIGNAPLEPIDLRVNFRSRPGIVNWVNAHFRKAFPARDDIARGAVAYSPSVAMQDDDETQAVQFWLCEKDAHRTQEAQALARWVQRTRADYPEDSIAVLVRNRSHLQAIVPALHQAGIRWRAVDIDSLAQRPLISDLLALTRALLSPADRVAWLAVLRAPWCGLSLADLHQLCRSEKRLPDSLWQRLCTPAVLAPLSAAGQSAIGRVMSVLRPALAGRYRKPLRIWLEGVWLALGGAQAASSERELAQAPAFFELLEQFEAAGGISNFEPFEQAVAQLFAKPENDPDIRVEIMTIHKSKGLEFDHVVIPGLDRANPPASRELLLWHERLSHQGEPLLLMASIPPKGPGEDRLYSYLKQEHRLKTQLENTRLLYVGATRAVKRLLLLSSAECDAQGDFRPPPENSLLHSLWPAVKDRTCAPPMEGASPVTQDLSAQVLQRLPADWRAPAFSKNELLAAYRGHEYQSGNTNLPDETMAHTLAVDLCLQQVLLAMSRRGATYWLSCGPAGRAGLLRTRLQQQGLPTDAGLLASLEQEVTQVLADPDGQWVLCDTHEQSRTDWQLQSALPDGSIAEYRVHRTFVTQDQYWLIDLDTITRSLGEPAAQARHHELEAKAAACAQLTDMPVRVATYYVRLCHLAVMNAL